MQKATHFSYIHSIIKTLSFLFVFLIQFRVISHESLALSDVVFIPLSIAL